MKQRLDVIDNVKEFFGRYAIYIILFFAFCIRFNGLGFGLPNLYGTDEKYIVPVVQRMLVTGDLNPHWFGFPGSFIMYLLAILFAVILEVLYVYHFLLGYAGNFSEFVSIFRDNPTLNTTVFYFSGRLLMVVFAIITIYLVYAISKKLFNKHVGLLAAFCLSIAPLYVDHSRIIRPDITATMLILLSLYFLLEYTVEKKKTYLLILSSLCAGFSIATKYTSAVSVIPILTHCFIMDYKQKGLLSSAYLKDFFLLKTNASKTVFYVFFGFFLFAPYFLLDFYHAAAHIVVEARSEHVGHGRLPGIQNHIWYLKNALQIGIGGLFFEILAGVGLFLILFKKSYKKYLFLIFPILYYVLIVEFGGLRWNRWLIPLLPFEAILFGIGFYTCYRYLIEKKFKKYKQMVFLSFAGILLFASIPTIVNDIRYGIKLTRTDTRTIAKNWIEENLPRGATIAYENGMVAGFRLEQKKDFNILYMGTAVVNVEFSYYKEHGVDYFVIIRDLKELVLNEPFKYRGPFRGYKKLERDAELIKVFDNKENPGPVIEIYKLM